jgi:putative restriction endonuclease
MTKLQILNAIAQLRTDRSNTWPDSARNQAPHKPLLLLSVVDGYEQGWIAGNRIALDPRLIEQFGAYWEVLMGDQAPTIANPFYHLQSSSLWSLRFMHSAPQASGTPSVPLLQASGAYAELEPMLYSMMCDPVDRAIIRSVILQSYFSDEGAERISLRMRLDAEAVSYAAELDTWVNEPFELMATIDTPAIYTTTTKEVRDRGFSIRVRDLYRNTCAICRSRVVTPQGYTLVDAAHVWPRSISRNDDPRNGMALCKTHHWMFDQYMVSVTPDHRIRLSPWLNDNGQNIEGTLNLEGNPIQLPSDSRFKPAPVALEMHFGRFTEMHS